MCLHFTKVFRQQDQLVVTDTPFDCVNFSHPGAHILVTFRALTILFKKNTQEKNFHVLHSPSSYCCLVISSLSFSFRWRHLNILNNVSQAVVNHPQIYHKWLVLNINPYGWSMTLLYKIIRCVAFQRCSLRCLDPKIPSVPRSVLQERSWWRIALKLIQADGMGHWWKQGRLCGDLPSKHGVRIGEN